MIKTFKHSGDLGDIVYAMPTIKALGGGLVYLNFRDEYKIDPKPRFSESSIDLIKPLLLAQDYIAGVEIYNGEEIDFDLDIFRLQNDLTYTNLAESHAAAFGLKKDILKEPWLRNLYPNSDETPDFVIFNKTPRYLKNYTSWKQVFDSFTGEKAFIGLKEEYEAFRKEVGEVKYINTKDLLEVSAVLSLCSLFVGNQSSAYAIAEGMKINTLQFVCSDCPNCIFERENAQYLY